MIVDENTKIYVGDTKIGVIYQGDDLLRDGYIPLEYIETNGYSYIDTNFVITKGMQFELDMMFSVINEQSLLGAVDFSSGIRRSHLACYNWYEGPWQLGIGAYNDYPADFYPQPNIKYNLKGSTIPNEVYLDINDTRYVNATTSYIFRTPLNCWVGAVNGLVLFDQIPKILQGRIYKCKIYDENKILIRDYRPYYSTKEQKAGLYDILHNVFYTSATAVDFISGPYL